MKTRFCLGVFLAVTSSTILLALPAFAQESSLSGGAEVDLAPYKEETRTIRDPENYETVVDAGESPYTEGDLRLDFVPSINFSTVMISDKDSVFSANAQLFKSDVDARGNFVQISDYRDNPNGWTLQVRQENQFKHVSKQGAELKGAVISFDQIWTNSSKDAALSPSVAKEVIQMNNIGETYNLAVAQPEKGTGTWSIVFGASESNKNERSNTLAIRKDKDNKEIIDPNFNKPVYSNSAVSLSVPGATEKTSGAYSTVLTWIIAELP